MKSVGNATFPVRFTLFAWMALTACAKAPLEHPTQLADQNVGVASVASPSEVQPGSDNLSDTTPEGIEVDPDRDVPPPVVNGPHAWRGEVLVLGEGDLLLDVAIQREKRDTTWNEAFVPRPDAHVRIGVARNEHLADGPVNEIATWDIPMSKVPVRVQWQGDGAAALAEGDEFLFFISVYNHKGDEPRVGDLSSEYVNELTAKEKDLTVELAGLEHCSSPQAGGYCTSLR